MGDLGTFVRQRRRELNLTLEEVAAMTGVSHQAISQLELGLRTGLRATTARKLALALQVSSDELLEKLPVSA